jgi:hypothetical protein
MPPGPPTRLWRYGTPGLLVYRAEARAVGGPPSLLRDTPTAAHAEGPAAQCYFLNAALQFRTTVIGEAGASSTRVFTRNRWPSAVAS